jgi:pimeloyl-ACP methyl ester carboxylesterase
MVITPDLLGFGDAFSGVPAISEATAHAHAKRILELITKRGLRQPLVAGYDIGSRIAQAVARLAPDSISSLVITPAYPGIAERSLEPSMQSEFWYQHFHRLPIAEAVLDADRRAIEAYLRYFWTHWSADADLTVGPAFDDLVDAYARPGAFTASLAWYRANKGYAATHPVTVPTTMLWGKRDPLFPTAWADRIDEWFTDIELRLIPGAGHFLPLEAPEDFASAITDRLL